MNNFMSGKSVSVLASAALLASTFAWQTSYAADDTMIEEVVVTGSRIKRSDSSSISPITVLSEQALELSGNMTLEDFIQDMPAVNGGDYGGEVNNGNPGYASVSLRGLGPNRTLVLVNGRRFAASADDGFVDLNMIPASIVERIEVLRDGASTVYGSDAIAGVVNIITKRDFEGADLEFGYDVTGESDGDQYNFAATFGSTFDRGNFVLSTSVHKRDEIRQGDRAFSACPLSDDGTATFCGGSPTTTPAQFVPLIDDPGYGLVLDGGVPRRFDDARDAFNFAKLSYMVTPQDVYSVYGAMNYELMDTDALGLINANMELNYTNRTSDQLLAPVGTFGGWLMGASHPDNPFGEALCAQTALCTQPQAVATSRRLTESGGRRFTQDVNTWRVSVGLDGEFSNGWSWDANYTIARWEDSQRDEGRPNRPAIEAMMDPVKCATFGGCPGIFNPLVSDSMTPAQIAFGFVGVNTKEESSLNLLQVNVAGGTGLELPGGEIAWAVGYENRREDAASKPDGGAAIGAIAFTPGNVTAGGFEIDEFYGEVVLPIMEGAPMAEVLSVEASARWTDVSFVADSETVFKVSGEWAPVEDVRFRATYAEGFRAPSVGELFLGQQQSAETYTDPCQNYGGGGVSANVVANCQADGLAPDFNLGTFQATTLQGGNPNLRPETSESVTFGIVFTPSAVEGLTLTLDYFDIQIEDAVATAPTSEVITSCYNSAGFSDPLCVLIVGPATPGVDETPLPSAPGRRNSNRQISGVLATNANLATYETSGFDFQADYGFDTSFGLVDLQVVGTYLDTYDYLPFSGGNTIRLAGFFGGDPSFGNPATFAEWQINYSATLTQDNWGANITAKWMDSTQDIAASAAKLDNEADSIVYWDVQGYYQWENVTFTAGIRNLTDEDPPYMTAYDDMNTLQFSYDTQGRYYYARAAVSF